MTKLIAQRISTKVRALDDQCDKLYCRSFRQGADEQFWRDVDALDTALGPKLKSATSLLEVDGPVRTFWAGFQKACAEGRKRVRGQ